MEGNPQRVEVPTKKASRMFNVLVGERVERDYPGVVVRMWRGNKAETRAVCTENRVDGQICGSFIINKARHLQSHHAKLHSVRSDYPEKQDKTAEYGCPCSKIVAGLNPFNTHARRCFNFRGPSSNLEKYRLRRTTLPGVDVSSNPPEGVAQSPSSNVAPQSQEDVAMDMSQNPPQTGASIHGYQMGHLQQGTSGQQTFAPGSQAFHTPMPQAAQAPGPESTTGWEFSAGENFSDAAPSSIQGSYPVHQDYMVYEPVHPVYYQRSSYPTPPA
ncbi:hypothetical protein F4861DRAFT_344098 [Xylaria intraflava]|nr:hypothetical protein F4861DRAFT_344098 [Xylaria intraflava]